MQTQVSDGEEHTLPLFARCVACGRTWDHDSVVCVTEQGEDANLDEFVGLPLSHARDVLFDRGEHGGVVHELSPYVRKRSEDAFESQDWTYTIQEGDIGIALMTMFHHPDCRNDLTESDDEL